MESPIQPDNENKKQTSLIGHVVQDLGGVLFAVEAIDKVLGFVGTFTKNRFYQNAIKVMRGCAPVMITGQKIYTSVKEFREQQKQLYARQRKSVTILRLMKQEHLEEYELDYYDFNVGREIMSWLMSRPKTENFKIVEFYNAEFVPISSKNFDKGELYVMVEYDNAKFMMEVDVANINGQIFVSSCRIHTTSRTEKVGELRTNIFSEFIKYFDTSKNIIEMDAKGLRTRKRLGFQYNVYQFDVKNFQQEIQNAVAKAKKRGYVLVGPPGVGKSTVLIKLEEELPEIPVVYIAPSAIVFREDVTNVFNFLRSISPCIAILEDLDGSELKNKYDRIFGEFIEQIDSLKHKECVIIIATVNEINIHPSLINRRGRFDKVFFFDYPKSCEEILSVMKNKYNKECHKDFPYDFLDDNIVQKIVNYKFSHSDICEVIESLVINDIEITQENIEKSVDGVIETMKAIQKCANGNEDDEDDEDDDNEPVGEGWEVRNG